MISFIFNCYAIKNKAFFVHYFWKWYRELFLGEYSRLFEFAAGHMLNLFVINFDIHSQMIISNIDFIFSQCFTSVTVTAFHQNVEINLNA
jgi:hypothetical protein